MKISRFFVMLSIAASIGAFSACSGASNLPHQPASAPLGALRGVDIASCADSNTCDPNCPGQVDSCTSSGGGDVDGGGGGENNSGGGSCTNATSRRTTQALKRSRQAIDPCAGAGSGGSSTSAPTPSRAAQIFARAKNFLGYQTGAIEAKIHGTACGYMVNLIQQPVTGITLSTWVPTMVLQMNADTADFQLLKDNTQAQPGDIVVKDGKGANPNDPHSPAQSHVGICATQGCTEIYSNSDSSNPIQFKNNYHGGPNMDGYQSIIYHVKN